MLISMLQHTGTCTDKAWLSQRDTQTLTECLRLLRRVNYGVAVIEEWRMANSTETAGNFTFTLHCRNGSTILHPSIPASPCMVSSAVIIGGEAGTGLQSITDQSK